MHMVGAMLSACRCASNATPLVMFLRRFDRSGIRFICCSSVDLINQSQVLQYGSYSKRRKKYKDPINLDVKTKKELVDVYEDMNLVELSNALDVPIDLMSQEIVKLDGRYRKFAYKPQEPMDIAAVAYIVASFGKRSRRIRRPSLQEDNGVKDAFPQLPAPVEECITRAPVVTIMGHVDHGKTTLLDALRNSRIVAGEFGGITQHIGAFSVTLPKTKDKVTFLDTPGHAAFKAMRERGARSTDVVVLVVAADDGVKDQTIESIRYAKEASVPIVVAINKCDKPNADPIKARHDLMQHDVIVEDMGGDALVVEISALQGNNLDVLQEILVFQAELMELRATPKGFVEGVIIEATTVKGLGKACTMVVNRGTLRKGAILVAGSAWGRVKTMHDEFHTPIEEAGPSCPVRITGWRDELPHPGEIVLQLENEERAKEVAELRMEKEREKKFEKDDDIIKHKRAEHYEKHKANKAVLLKKGWMRGSTLRHVESKRKQWERWDTYDPNATPELALILKCDVDGTLEAIMNVLDTYESDEVKFTILDFDVGSPNELNLEMAEKFKAFVFCFNVPVPANIQTMAMEKGVTIEQHNVIYNIVDRLKDLLSQKLPDLEDSNLVGEGHVLKEFRISDKGKKRQPIAGVLIDSGTFKKDGVFRITRAGSSAEGDGPLTIYEGTIESLKHEQNFIDVANSNTEVGIALADKTIRFHPDDTVECIEKVVRQRRIEWDPPGF